MNLSYRPASASEIPSLLNMLPDGLELTALQRCHIASIWRKWRSLNMMLLTVIEQTDDLGVRHAVAFGSSVFVSDQLAMQLTNNSAPPVIMQICKHFDQGFGGILTLNEIRLANSTQGLNLLIPIIGWQQNIEEPAQVIRIKAKLLEAFYFTHGGYNIMDTIQEVYSELEMKRALAAGANLRTNYSHSLDNRVSPETIRPYLIGVNRDEAVEGTYLHAIYLHNPPKLMFSLPEQNVLELAVLDMTDREIASALSVGEATIKKRWRSIIERATLARHVPWHPPEIAASGATVKSVRGLEKRRHIISYVRSHLEELRPYAPRKD